MEDLIDTVTTDLEKRGAKCHIYVNAICQVGETIYELDHIRAYFPSGKRWDIVKIEGG